MIAKGGTVVAAAVVAAAPELCGTPHASVRALIGRLQHGNGMRRRI
jgi:hypothetical protein